MSTRRSVRKPRQVEPLSVEVYTKNDAQVPKKYIRQILNRYRWAHLCQSSIPYKDFGRNAFQNAEITLLLVSGQVVEGFLLGLTPNFITTLDVKPKPVCRPDELYLDLICVSNQAKGGGQLLQRAFENLARSQGKTAIRLYATDLAYPYWVRQGYTECENPRNHRSCFRKRYRADKDQGVRMTKSIATKVKSAK